MAGTEVQPAFHSPWAAPWADLHLQEEGAPFLNLYKTIIWDRGGPGPVPSHASVTLLNLLTTC